MSSVKSLTNDAKFSGRSLMYIRKNSDPDIDPWGTRSLIGKQ